MNFVLLAQSTVVDMNDLRFLRFPQGNLETVLEFVAVLVLMAGTVIATLIVQRWAQSWWDTRVREGGGAKAGPKLDPRQQAALDLLKFFTDPAQGHRIAKEARAFEEAVERSLPAASDADLADIRSLRLQLHMTVSNSEQEVISTRQLVEESPVRVLATVSGERLDLYCTLLEVNERYLMIEVPYQEEAYSLLAANPAVCLVYWGEERGEVLFDVTLEPVQAAGVPAFRAKHGIRSKAASKRGDFRLTVDLPITYAYMSREELIRHKQSGQGEVNVRGEGRVTDLSHGGAALMVSHAMAKGGLAQVHMTLAEEPVRMMMEVLNVGSAGDGLYSVRGRFRGANPEFSGRLNAYLSREQIRRLREKETILVKAS